MAKTGLLETLEQVFVGYVAFQIMQSKAYLRVSRDHLIVEKSLELDIKELRQKLRARTSNAKF